MKFKSKLASFLLASSLLFGGALIGCKTGGGSKPTPKPDFYLTVPTDDEYTIGGVTNGQAFKEGQTVSFTVTLTHPDDYELTSVFYNSTRLDPTATGYSFLMPNENVELRVNINEIDKFDIVLSSPEVVIGATPTTATLYFGSEPYNTDPYIIYEETGEGVTGDVDISGNTVTGVTAGTVKLNAKLVGEDEPLLETAKSVTVRLAKKGETKEMAFTAQEAWQQVSDNKGTWPSGESPVEYYTHGIVKEFKSFSDEYERVELKLECGDHQFTVYRAKAAFGSDLRDKLDLGSDVYVYAKLKAQGNTYETTYGEFVDVINETPYALVSEHSGLMIKPGATASAGARIAPKGSDTTTAITYSIPAADAAIATVAEDGTVTAHSEGKTTLTVTAEGFTALSIPVTVMTTEHAGTEADPFSVDDAIAVSDAIGENQTTPDKYFIKGVVRDVEEHHSSEYENSTFNLLGTERIFIGFQVSTTVEQDNALVKGAEVVINSAIKNYNGKAETTDKASALLKSIDVADFHLIETTDNDFQVSLQDGDYSLADFATGYPTSVNKALTYTSGDEEVFTIVDGNKIHPVAAGVATLTVSGGTASVEATVEVVEGPAVNKWDTSKLVLPTGITKVVTLDEVEFPEIPDPAPTATTTIYGDPYYVICRVDSLGTSESDLKYGNGTLSNKLKTMTMPVRGMSSFDGKYNYQDLTFKPVADSIVVLYCSANIYYQPADSSHPNPKITYQLGGNSSTTGNSNTKVMQLDGVVQTTPEIVGIEMVETEKTVKVEQEVSAFQVKSTRADAPLDSSVAITWDIASGSEYADVDQTTGAITGLAEGEATVRATYGTTGLTATAPVHVVPASAKVEETVEMYYTGTTSTNMSGTANNATTVNLDETVFTVSSIKNDPSNQIGLNKDGTMRLYNKENSTNGNTLKVEVAEGALIKTITVTLGRYTDIQLTNAEVKAGETVVTGTSGAYTINATSFSIQNKSNVKSKQLHIAKIVIVYEH